MLGYLFGFNARLGRIQYFLANIALAVAMTAVCFVIAQFVFQNTMRGMLANPDLMVWQVIAAGLFFLWMTFTLQSMRVRDIGWDPVCVIPAWIAILAVDHFVAGRFPAFSLGHQHQATIVGGLTNFLLFVALMFWPSGDHDSRTFNDAYRKADRSPQKAEATSVAAERIARAGRAEFGRTL